MIDGQPTGYVDCAGAWTHRQAITTCPDLTPSSDVCEGVGGNCVTDADCTAMPYGHCQTQYGHPFCGCTYGCATDSDCEAGNICVCGYPVGFCHAAACRSDADCGPGLCATYIASPGCGGVACACQSTDDECTGDGDCTNGQLCTWTGNHRTCVLPSCTAGRVIAVPGEQRLAALAPRSGD